MKYTMVLLSLMAAASAANVPNINAGALDMVARDEAQGEHHHHEQHHHQESATPVVPRDEPHDRKHHHGTSPEVVARGEKPGEIHHHDEEHHHYGATSTTVPSVIPRHGAESLHDMDHEEGLEKRKKVKFRYGNNKDNTTATSGASAFMNLNVGILVAGLVGPGVGAIFL